MTDRSKDLPLFARAAETPGENLETDSSSKSPTKDTRPKAITVTELTQKIKGTLEPAFSEVWVQGEISNYRPPSGSGHVYFTLKDQGAAISAAIFGWSSRTKTGGKGFELKDGLQVLCRGKVSVYALRGNYQIVVDRIEPLGAGALQLAFEQLKAKLQKEGLFDPSRKRKIPPFPKRIAIVTSPTGAAIRDMLQVLGRRAPHIRVTVVPAVVQGDDAPRQVMRGIELANQHGLGDIICLARGGGSIEDLWCFNDEALARAIVNSKIPIVNAVGHEIDFTIADFVADLRAPTPSAAAEMMSAHWVDVTQKIIEFKRRIWLLMTREIENRKNILKHVAARLISPKDKLREQAQRLDETYDRLVRAIKIRIDRRRMTLDQLIGKLDALSPLRVLKRGYTIVKERVTGQVVKSHSQAHQGAKLSIQFHDGEKLVQVIE